MDPRLNAIRELRCLSEQFASGQLPFERFLRNLGWHSFDDEDEEGRYDPVAVVKDLPVEFQTEYLFYVKWRDRAADGSFNSPNWVYGESSEPYGWIDKARYRSQFADEFSHLFRLDLPKA